MLIEHRPSHLNQGTVPVLNNPILRWNIWGRVLMFKTLATAKGIKAIILEFCTVVTANCSNGMGEFAFQPKHKIVNVPKSFILCSQKENPRIARKIVNDH